MKLKINHQEIEGSESMTVLDVAGMLGIEIPTMCFLAGHSPNNSCMMCTVVDEKTGHMFLACSEPAREGMSVITESEEISAARKSTLELLLSEHVGDCEAPCQRVCPGHMDIPEMIRQVQVGNKERALEIIREDLPFSSILARTCHAPCEGGCRRIQFDEGVAIQNLVAHVSDWALAPYSQESVQAEVAHQTSAPHLPQHSVEEKSGKKVAVIGSGAAGLACAWFLIKAGHEVDVFERDDEIGGKFRDLTPDQLPEWILKAELNVFRESGVRFHSGAEINTPEALEKLKSSFDAVVLAMGECDHTNLGVPLNKNGIKVNQKSFQIDGGQLFACGDCVKPGKKIIHIVAQAKACALMMDQFVRGQQITGEYNLFNSTVGRLLEDEINAFVACADDRPRVQAQGNHFSNEEAVEETQRCMHCDCRDKDDCTLRIYSDRYGASKQKYKGAFRRPFEQESQNNGVLYESGKCVKCGICVQISKEEEEPFGLAFVGRGYDMRTGVSLNQSLDNGLKKTAKSVVKACPTGALAMDRPDEKNKSDSQVD